MKRVKGVKSDGDSDDRGKRESIIAIWRWRWRRRAGARKKATRYRKKRTEKKSWIMKRKTKRRAGRRREGEKSGKSSIPKQSTMHTWVHSCDLTSQRAAPSSMWDEYFQAIQPEKRGGEDRNKEPKHQRQLNTAQRGRWGKSREGWDDGRERKTIKTDKEAKQSRMFR